MSFEKARDWLAARGFAGRIRIFEASSATVELAAMAVGCAPNQIAKTMSFLVEEQPILIVAAGDVRIDNKKYKAWFHKKAKMIPPEQVEAAVGHAPGGVCPFAVLPGTAVYLDRSLCRFDVVYPAAGSDHSAVALAPGELAALLPDAQWVDVCQMPG